ncbi:hypothetical protein AC1031_019374 [Aphanomyces cochlioides]|nr:hypothetical protein AC1031_019374 [Aphanomyces cochlioides]
MAVPKDYVRIDKSSLKPGHGPVYGVGSLPAYEFPSMLHVVQNSVKNGPNNAFLGHRPLNEAGDAGNYVWETYTQCYKRIQNLAERVGFGTICCHVLRWFSRRSLRYVGRKRDRVHCYQTSVTTVVCTSSELPKVLKARGQAMFTSEAVHFSYLPLAHCSEHMTNSYEALKKSSTTLSPFARHFSPLLNKFYDKITSGAKAAGGLKTWFFDYALYVKLKNFKKGYNTHFLYDALIFSSIKAKLGLDRCCCVITGAAPIAPHVLDFLRVLFGCAVHEAYGQSEAMGAVAGTLATDLGVGDIGYPTVACHIKLISVPEMGYEVTDTEHKDGEGICLPVNGRGEVCLRGDNVFTGYYKAPDKTAEAVDEDGWLRTGDIGVWTKDDRLKIVDRKKNIFKLSQGEYVAPEKIENVLVNCLYVAQPFVYGDHLHAVLVAIIVPEEENLVALANSMEITGSFADLCSNKQVTDAVLTDLTVLCKKSKLCGFEIPKAIKLEPTPFTVENNLMTPTFKLKRVDVKAAFLQDIDRLYVQCGDLVAGR